MSDLLESVDRCIKQCEWQRDNVPEYYKQFVKEQHELFTQIRKELEANANLHR